MSSYFIVGASRGIGFEYARQLLEEHKDTKVIAGARKTKENEELQKLLKQFSSRLTLVDVDTTNTESINKAAAELTAKFPEGIDYTIVNAGVYGDKHADPKEMIKTIDTNSLGPLRVFQAFLPLIKKSHKKFFVSISSIAGCIAMQKGTSEFFKGVDPSGCSSYGYRMSKAALNALTAMLAADHMEEGITVISLHPGTVETEMFYDTVGTEAKEQAKNFQAKTPETSVKKQLETIHKVAISDSGKFFNSENGDVLPF